MLARTAFLAAIVVLLLGAEPAGAIPPGCEFSCTPTSSCSQLCSEGRATTTCGAFGVCVGGPWCGDDSCNGSETWETCSDCVCSPTGCAGRCGP